MLGYYEYSRKNIVNMIKNSPRTEDGYYFMKDFPIINLKQSNDHGEKDNDFFYNRELFKNKIIFSEYEINSYISSTDLNLDIERMQALDLKLKDVIQEFIMYELNDEIPNYEFNLNELIDTTIYLFDAKY